MIYTNAEIIYNRKIAKDIFKIILEIEELPEIKPGQFVMIDCGREDGKLLKRPLSIHSFDNQSITLIYENLGKGTSALSQKREGNYIDILLPLGNGFEIKDNYKKIALIGGGLGVFPLYSIIQEYPKIEYYSYIGFRNIDKVVCDVIFHAKSKLCQLTTDDGSFGKKAFVTDIFKEDIKNEKFDAIFACGPRPMLKSLKNSILDIQIPTFVSMEERMGCGFGVCLTCSCSTKSGNKRVCLDGPVFDINEVIL